MKIGKKLLDAIAYSMAITYLSHPDATFFIGDQMIADADKQELLDLLHQEGQRLKDEYKAAKINKTQR